MKATLTSRVHFKLALDTFVRCHLCLCNRCQASHRCIDLRQLEVLWSTPWISWFDRRRSCGNKTIFSSQMFHSFTQLSTWQWNIIGSDMRTEKWSEMMRCCGPGQASTSVNTGIAMESTLWRNINISKREFSIAGTTNSSNTLRPTVDNIKCDIVQNTFQVQDPGHGFFGKRLNAALPWWKQLCSLLSGIKTRTLPPAISLLSRYNTLNIVASVYDGSKSSKLQRYD